MPHETRVKLPARNVLSAIFSTHWAITEDALRTILAIAGRENEGPEALAARLGRQLDNTHAVTIRDGVASIPVHGPLFRYADWFTEISAATTYEQLALDLRAALDDRSVRSILLDIDSPGGDANGVSQLAAMIRTAAAEKPVVAFVGGTGASAAYWLGSAASAVVVSDTAVVGSIGVRTAYRDTRAAEEARGFRTIEIVSSQSPNKRMDPTEDAGRAQIQAVIDDLAQVFIDTVALQRGVAPDTVMADFGQGGVFVGRRAVEQGLADAVGTYESTLAELRDRGLDAVTSWRAKAPKARATLTTPSHEASMTEQPTTAAGGASSDQPSGATATDTTPPTTTAAEPAATEQPTAAQPTADAIAQARAEAATQERARIAAIRTLGVAADAALVEACVNDPSCSADMAARKFLEAHQAKAQGALAGLKRDEQQSQHPAAHSGTTAEGDPDRAAAKQILAVHAQVAGPRRLPTTRST